MVKAINSSIASYCSELGIERVTFGHVAIAVLFLVFDQLGKALVLSYTKGGGPV